MTTLLTAPLPAPGPQPVKMTADEFMARYEGVRAELIQGVVREHPMAGLEHGTICLRIGALLLAHVDANRLGRVMSNDSWVVIGPDVVYGGDILYYSFARLPRDARLPKKAHTVPPELVVEVKSPSDRWIDVLGKVVDYITSGVLTVVVIDPGTATVSVYGGDRQQILTAADTLTLPDVLPGFSTPVAALLGLSGPV